MSSSAASRSAQAVLFDLDGTFADTAPDLGAALNRLRDDAGLPPVPLSTLRAHTSSGVRGMLGAGMGIDPQHAQYRDQYRRFLEHYEAALCVATTLFAGVAELIEVLEKWGLAWGIVTNKTQRFTNPLLDRLGYLKRADCIVSGDSSPRIKPSPQPMQLAAALLGVDATRCVYVGDDLRDIVAGRAGGMKTIAVRYGYLGTGVPIEDWGADVICDTAATIADHLTF
jgi:phosphoglycolate phosphatase